MYTVFVYKTHTVRVWREGDLFHIRRDDDGCKPPTPAPLASLSLALGPFCADTEMNKVVRQQVIETGYVEFVQKRWLTPSAPIS